MTKNKLWLMTCLLASAQVTLSMTTLKFKTLMGEEGEIEVADGTTNQQYHAMIDEKTRISNIGTNLILIVDGKKLPCNDDPLNIEMMKMFTTHALGSRIR